MNSPNDKVSINRRQMKPLLSSIGLPLLLVACVTLAISTCIAASAAEATPQENSSALLRLQDLLDQQTKRIDRLYRALGPHLQELEERAAAAEKQEHEERALTLERICEVKDPSLQAIGCVNPAAAEFAVLTTGGGVRVFDATGKPVKELQSPGQEITCLAFSVGGSELLTGTASGGLLVWDVAKGSCATVATNVGRKVDRVTWLGRDRVAWGSMVKYWEDGGKPVDHDKPAGAVLDRLTGQVRWTFRSFVRDDFFTLAGAQDGSRLVVQEIPGEPRGAFLLDGATGKVLRTCFDNADGHSPLSLALSSDSRTLAVGYPPHDIILWNAQTGARQKLLKGHSNWVVSLAFSADGKRLISGAGDSTARVCDVESGEEMGRIRFPGESSYVEGVGLSPKGDLAFAVARERLVVARVTAGEGQK